MIAAEKFGMQIFVCGPEALLPTSDSSYISKANFDDIIPEVDAVMMLRIQLERHENLELNPKTYHEQFGLNPKRVAKMKSKSIILHPGPFNRGVEISDEIVEHKQSRIFKQMGNGVHARMAILEWSQNRGNV